MIYGNFSDSNPATVTHDQDAGGSDRLQNLTRPVADRLRPRPAETACQPEPGLGRRGRAVTAGGRRRRPGAELPGARDSPTGRGSLRPAGLRPSIAAGRAPQLRLETLSRIPASYLNGPGAAATPSVTTLTRSLPLPA